MKRFIQGECRTQSTLLSEILEDYVADTNPVRVVDVFFDELDLGKLVVLCRQLGLLSQALVAIDGAKFKAVNNRDRNFTSAKLQRCMQEIEASISGYLAALDTADRQEAPVAQVKTERLQDKIAALKARMQELKALEARLNATAEKQISLTDPDARSMKTRGTGIVGYNARESQSTRNTI